MSWLLVWRSLLLSCVSVFLLAFISRLLGVPPWVSMLLAAIIAIAIINPIVISKLLRKRFKGFKLEIVRTELKTKDLRQTAAERASGIDNKTQPKTRIKTPG